MKSCIFYLSHHYFLEVSSDLELFFEDQRLLRACSFQMFDKTKVSGPQNVLLICTKGARKKNQCGKKTLNIITQKLTKPTRLFDPLCYVVTRSIPAKEKATKNNAKNPHTSPKSQEKKMFETLSFSGKMRQGREFEFWRCVKNLLWFLDGFTSPPLFLSNGCTGALLLISILKNEKVPTTWELHEFLKGTQFTISRAIFPWK